MTTIDTVRQRQVDILRACYADTAPQTVRGLADALGMDKSFVSRAVNSLVVKGLLRRVTDDDDRRSVLIFQTAIGAKAAGDSTPVSIDDKPVRSAA